MHDVERDWTTNAGFRAVCLWVQDSHRCGYVGIPKDHPLHGVEYYDDCEVLKKKLEEVKNGKIGKRGILSVFCYDGKSATPEIIFDVHGGITYSGGSLEYPVENEDLWWFGFDCAHCDDWTKHNNCGTARTLEYVIAECESLAEQLKEIEE